MVQVAANPRLVDELYTEEPCKVPALEALLDEAIDAGEKIIVWTSFTENADWLVRRYDRFGSVRVHGGLTISDRNAKSCKIQGDSECRVLIATPGVAKEGLTLTVANHAVFFDRSFSLDDYLQAQDRIIESLKPSHVLFIIS